MAKKASLVIELSEPREWLSPSNQVLGVEPQAKTY